MNEAALRRERLIRSFPHLVLFALLGTFLCLGELKSPHYVRLLQEDGWAEWATFTAFAAAFVFGVRAFRQTDRTLLARVSALLLGLFCLFVAGEEISWGQRIVGFRPPVFFLEQNYQQETNLHNLLKNVLDTRFMVMAIALSYGVIAPFLAHVTRYPRELSSNLAYLPWYTAVAWLEFSYPYGLVGEFAELVLGLLFLADLTERAQSSEEPAFVSLRCAGAQVVALASALLIIPLNDTMLDYNREAFSEAARRDLEVLQTLVHADELLQKNMLRKKRVHKRIYTAVRAGYLKLDPQEHYLDPWNNPYWLLYQQGGSAGGGTAMLYSFGPNRRRDLPLDEAENGDLSQFDGKLPRGDDLLVVVKLTRQVQASR